MTRSPDFNTTAGLADTFKPEISLEIFRRMCLVRYFETGVIRAVEDKRVIYPTYLSLGQETIAAAVSVLTPDYLIFTQHRCHDKYLAYGGNPKKLKDELLGLPTGTSGGRAGSNCIQCHEDGIHMYGHHGLIGENVPLGVGAALGSNKPVICYFGDGAAEEDYVFSSIGFAASRKLPVMFVCEDNNLSILTPVETRRRWKMTEITEAFGIPSVDITDDPWTIYSNVLKLRNNLPAFLNIHTCRANWHVGVGTDGPPEWDRFSLVKQELNNLGLRRRITTVEKNTSISMQNLWKG